MRIKQLNNNVINYPTLIEFSQKISQIARNTALPYFRSKLLIEDKSDLSPVTIADQQTELQIRALIKNTFPEHGILGEEFGGGACDNEYTWVIDPIDGTRAFVMGIPLFTTLVALLKEGVPLFGMMDALALNEQWLGFKGEATLFNGIPLSKLDTKTTLNRAQVFATTPDMFVGRDELRFNMLKKNVKACRFGADGYGYGQVALGHADAVIEADLKPYDCLPLVPILEGVGAVITDWVGQPLCLSSDGRVVASSHVELHQEILKILASND